MFKAKRIDNGEWVEGSHIKDYIHHIKNGNETITQGSVYYEIDPETLTQIGGKDFEALEALYEDLAKKIEASKAENEKMKEALENIEKSCDGNNPEHELFWQVSYNTLQQLKKKEQ